MRKISYNDVTRAIYRLRQKWLKKENLLPQFINSGCCDMFAWELREALDAIGTHSGLDIWGDDIPELFPNGYDPEGHCFFRFEGKFFDAECPQGVKSPHLLPYYQRGKPA